MSPRTINNPEVVTSTRSGELLFMLGRVASMFACVRSRGRWRLVTTAALLAVFAAPAAAAPLNVASDHVALHAYQRFLGSLISRAPAGRRKDDAFIASVSANCPNVLAAVNLLPASSVNQSVLTAFGEEIGGDILVLSFEPSRRALARMDKTVSRLSWSSRRTRMTVAHYLATARDYFRVQPSDLCNDARALAASNAQITPSGTLRWLARLGREGTKLRAATSAYEKIIRRFATPADLPSIIAIGHLLGRLSSTEEAVLKAELPKLLSAIGIAGY